MRSTLTILFTLICAATFNQVSAQEVNPKLTRQIEQMISKQATLTGSSENEESRQLVFGDLNGDGRKDAVVLYTLEGEDGTNNWEQFVAVFLAAGDGSYKFQTRRLVGGKGTRSVEIRSVVNEEVRLKTEEYRPNDPDCCPSRSGSTALRLDGKRLLESKSTRQVYHVPAVRHARFLCALIAPEESGRLVNCVIDCVITPRYCTEYDTKSPSVTE